MTAAIVLTPADLLAEAASLIERRGWTQREFTNKAGRLCVRGALHVAAGRAADDCEREKPDSLLACPCEEPSYELAVWLFLDLPLDNDGDEIEDAQPEAVSNAWNDRPGMTEAEVVSTLRTVADRVRAREVAS